MYIDIVIVILFDGVLISHPVAQMKFSLITIYGSNDPSNPTEPIYQQGY